MVLYFISCDVERVYILQEFMLDVTVLPKIQFGLLLLIYQNAKERLFQVLHLFAISELAASIPDDLLLQENDDKEEVEISKAIRHSSVSVDVV